MRGTLSAVAAKAEQPKDNERGALLHWKQVQKRLPKGPNNEVWSEWRVKKIMREVGHVRFSRVAYVYEADLARYLGNLAKVTR